jgi:hypothetical protein
MLRARIVVSLLAVLQIRDVYLIPDPTFLFKFKYFYPKHCFLSPR